MGVVYEEFYIHSDIPTDLMNQLYFYIIGCCDVNRERRKTKCLSYKRKGGFTKFNEAGEQIGGTKDALGFLQIELEDLE